MAARTGSGGINLLFPDQHGTALIAVGWGVGQAVNRRKQLPFGGSRSASGTWPGDRGFLSGTTDPTGTTHLGAREYDPDLGRFLSVDPLLLPEDPTQHNAYAYGNDNPATFADPTGQAYEECVSGQYNCTYGRSTGDVKKVTFGKNYKKETKARAVPSRRTTPSSRTPTTVTSTPRARASPAPPLPSEPGLPRSKSRSASTANARPPMSGAREPRPRPPMSGAREPRPRTRRTSRTRASSPNSGAATSRARPARPGRTGEP
ncbi:RHS repeat-associated core domain-containing protein [Streptomyces sp. INA 01156]